MAYNNFFPATYQPYQQPYQQSYQVQPQQSLIWVSGEREAQMYPVAPNNAVTLWSQNEPVVYLKQADATGKPTLKVYDLVERVLTPSDASLASGDKLSSYATKSDLEAVFGAVKANEDKCDELRAQVEKLSGQLKKKKGEDE